MPLWATIYFLILAGLTFFAARVKPPRQRPLWYRIAAPAHLGVLFYFGLAYWFAGLPRPPIAVGGILMALTLTFEVQAARLDLADLVEHPDPEYSETENHIVTAIGLALALLLLAPIYVMAVMAALRLDEPGS